VTAAHLCPLCGGQLRPFANFTLTIDHGGLSGTVTGVSGWQCAAADCAEMQLDDDSQRRYAEASDALVLAARRQTGQELRRIRRKLKLTQADAALLTGGGHNGFSRYEKGMTQPLPAVINLFRLLDHHPEMLGELLQDRQAPQTA
jgi:HTH-type transcriptional regulator / antitoxin MqsA